MRAQNPPHPPPRHSHALPRAQKNDGKSYGLKSYKTQILFEKERLRDPEVLDKTTCIKPWTPEEFGVSGTGSVSTHSTNPSSSPKQYAISRYRVARLGSCRLIPQDLLSTVTPKTCRKKRKKDRIKGPSSIRNRLGYDAEVGIFRRDI